jgi:hypothetical protein
MTAFAEESSHKVALLHYVQEKKRSNPLFCIASTLLHKHKYPCSDVRQCRPILPYSPGKASQRPVKGDECYPALLADRWPIPDLPLKESLTSVRSVLGKNRYPCRWEQLVSYSRINFSQGILPALTLSANGHQTCIWRALVKWSLIIFDNLARWPNRAALCQSCI